MSWYIMYLIINNHNFMSQQNDSKPSSEQIIQLNIDPDKIESRYSDAVFINFNPFGFTLDFAQNIPQMKIMKIIQRISFSPQHAKALALTLQNQILQYEKQFGQIPLTPAMQEQTAKNPIGFNIEDKK